ncbi:beta-glucosidase BglX [Pedobacter sp. BS3]|uniref:beta-glucosidase BglX n=1 Tax=Pedobacter sp. BS3 TaxID=2567937 RepID=UPI0011EE6D9C|nr:beta-glucosidase BglX [Pedobacter sp. BS3]TZF84913.1 beta-glucosidase BglX [Pedobacter sp. BS3]
MKKHLYILFLLSAFLPAYGQSRQNIEQKIEAVLSKMTVREKVGQLNQLDGRGIHGTIEQLKELVRRGEVGSLMNITDPKIVNQLQEAACKESHTKIPLIFTRDVVHGFKTMLPIPLGQAATFDPDLVKEGARITAVEATEHGIRWSFAPMIDISRDARWGRIAESFGEDTYLTGQMAVAVVKGFQGEDLANPQSMAACLKHFVGYGAAEGGRDYNSTYIPERQLRQVYLPPFKQGIEAGAASIMVSFNDNNGIPSTGNKYLLRNILRKEWGFDGVTLSDWGSVTEMIRHGFAEDRKQAAEIAMNAGLDVEMSSKSYIQNLEKLIAEGKVQETALDDAVRNILRLKYRLGLFERPYTDIHKPKETYSAKHLAVAKKLAEESVVLLKNENKTLPLSANIKSILITGPLADAPHDQLGTWTMDGEPGKTQTPAKAIANLYGNKVKVHVVPGLTYSRDKNQSTFDEVLRMARSVDAIVAFVGEEAILTGEAHSLAALNLQGAQSELIKQLSATGKPLVTVVLAGRPLTIGKEVEQSDAVLYAWHPGTMGGPAIADILFGKAIPAGKLPVTFPKEVGQIPIYYNHTNTGRPARGNEKSLDEIPLNAQQSVLGHSSYYLDIGSKPLYPFGYGLSYTSFEYADLKIANTRLKKNDTLSVSVVIKNTGQYTGTEIAQLYITDQVGSVTRPVKELKGFERVALNAGEIKTVHFNLPVSELAFWNSVMEKTVEPGKFKVMVGTNSENGSEATFEVL